MSQVNSKVEMIIKKYVTEVFEELSKYEKPKEVFYVDNFVATETTKINRKETIKKIKVV